MSARVIICCGSGGVGKTTVSAALAIKLAMAGERVAVLTIDPARRLADSLSIGEIGNTARAVPLENAAPGGTLDAMVLDAKATFDDLIRRISLTPEATNRVLENRYYQAASERLGGAHEYMAMHKLLDLWEHGPYDVIVLDTPPTRHALDFLAAPRRMAGMFDQGVLRWMVMPANKGGWRALELGSETAARVLQKVIGQGTIQEIAEFFDAFRGLWEGFRTRSLRVDALLSAPETQFLLVTSPAPAARVEAMFFLNELSERKLPFGGFLVNRAVVAPTHAAVSLDDIPSTGPLPLDDWQRVREALVQASLQRSELADRHAEAVSDLQSANDGDVPCWVIPEQDHDLHRLSDLVDLGPHLPTL
jgi:anion-transporting  ArsA/GET3 family ATPase